jgi:hypothetical protein
VNKAKLTPTDRNPAAAGQRMKSFYQLCCFYPGKLALFVKVFCAQNLSEPRRQAVILEASFFAQALCLILKKIPTE